MRVKFLWYFISTLSLFLVCFTVQGQEKTGKIMLSDTAFAEKLLWISQPGHWTANLTNISDSTPTLSDPSIWQPLDIRLVPESFSQDWNGYAWFHTQLQIDSSMYGKEIFLFGYLNGGADIFLDGNLVVKAGKPGTEVSREIATTRLRPTPILIPNKPTQSLTIRYSNFEAKPYWGHSFSGINLLAGTQDIVMAASMGMPFTFEQEIRRFAFFAGILLALALLHLILFFYFTEGKENLACSLFFFSLSGIFISGVAFNRVYTPLSNIHYWYGESISIILSGAILPFFIYLILKRSFDWIPYSLLVLAVFTFVLNVAFPFEFSDLVYLFFIISTSAGIGLVFHSRFMQKRKDLNIIIFFYLAALVMLMPGMIKAAFGIKFLWSNDPLYMNIPAIIAATAYSFYLARGVALTNRELKSKLNENERLTTEKLQVEFEKQALITQQKEKLEREVKERTKELEESLENLKSTQAQLIHSEKMASLGELTAGIAHEIQNPLNFVNNFSEVSNELIEEAREEMMQGDSEEANAILEDLKSNLEKITFHGHRASGIVRSMLEHSRTSVDEKVETDINALCDEYLRLAYHGMRAKDRSFNADFKTNLDPDLPKVKVVPQDIGRVLLNLINNAFYAVSDEAFAKADSDFKPLVSVVTKKMGDRIQITVSDNGPGVPEEIRDKIFQPFFTTKPTGQGTGLGLSLSYDIVKAHGGQLSVTSKLKEGSTFIIELPVP